MFARLSAFVVWALVAATVVFWVLRLIVHPLEVPPQALAVGKAAGARGDLTRLLGSAPVVVAAVAAAPEASSRFKLLGVMAPKQRANVASGAYGLALIAVDGKPARAFAVGTSVDSGLVLQSVGLRSASIASQQGAPTVLIELPPLAEPATGRLSGLGSTSVPPQMGGRPVPSVNPANPTIATLPQAAFTRDPAMAGQVPGGRQPPPVQDVPTPAPVPAPAPFTQPSSAI